MADALPTPPDPAAAFPGESLSDIAARAAWREREQMGLRLAMSELVDALAHDLNQPLAAIVTNANAAKRWLAASPPDLSEASEATLRIAHEGNRASQMIEHVRAQLRVDELQVEALSLDAVLADLVPTLQEEALVVRATLRVTLAPSLPQVLCDRKRLEQVFLHLIRNALEALGRGGVEPRSVEVGAVVHGKAELDIYVRDSGPGLKSDRELAFQPFYTTKSQGLGLGLNICRSLVRSFEGRLWAEANAEGGETFHFGLPLAPVRA